jgi:hypothetical protein
VVAHDLDCLLNAASPCHDVFRDDEALARLDLKSAAQNKAAVSIFFYEDVFLAKVAGDLLPDDDSAHGGRNDGFGIMGGQFFREHSTDARRHGSILEKQGALEKLPAVKATPEDKVSMQERPGFFEEIKNVLHARTGLLVRWII